MDLVNVESPKEASETPILLPLALDIRYNVMVCTECATGIAFDYVQRHLRRAHGIRKQLDDIMEHLNIDTPTLSSGQIKDWISEVWVLGSAINGVPIKKGIICTECHHSVATKKAMKNHFAAKHAGMKWSKNIEKCNVQMQFQGRFKKYIQIEVTGDEDVEMDTRKDWKEMLDQEFQETMATDTSGAAKRHSDVRLLSAFIAKVRWDLLVKDMELLDLQKLAAAPVRSDGLHKMILCGREYIDKCCNALNGGNMMLKRRLMSAGYISS